MRGIKFAESAVAYFSREELFLIFFSQNVPEAEFFVHVSPA